MCSYRKNETNSVCAIVLNWNNVSDTLKCIESIKMIPGVDLIVIDNGSTDDSKKTLSETLRAEEFIDLPNNLGFGSGNNVGIREVIRRGYEFTWLLNNDVIVDRSALRFMLDQFTDSNIGIVGSRLVFMEHPNKVQALGGGYVSQPFFRSIHIKEENEIYKLQYISAASMLIRIETIKSLEGFNERIFLYWEDVDLCYRARRLGWNLRVASESVVYHKESASSKHLGVLRQKYYTEGLDVFLQGNFKLGGVLALFANIIRFLYHLARFRLEEAKVILIFGVIKRTF